MAEKRLIQFEVRCIPPKATHHQKKIINVGGFSRLADKPQLKTAKAFWDTIFIDHQPDKPFDEAITVRVELTWPWNQGDSKKLRALGRVWHETSPDLSNMGKTIEDAMGRCGFFTNDSRIVASHFLKFRGDNPGIRVCVQPAHATFTQAESTL